MNKLWRMLLGIDQSPGVVSGGDSRLEFAALPRGPGAVTVILVVVVLLALLWRLYRWERRDLSRAKRAMLVGLRALTLLALAVMVIEPVLVSTRRETLRSHLPVILDDSESLRFSDPYTDNSRAVQVAAGLRFQSEGGKSPVDRLRET